MAQIVLDPGARRRIGEHGIDQRQHRRRGTEADIQPHLAPALPGRLDAGAQAAARAVECGMIGTLERKDRLLGVAHGEHGARTVARARTGEELVGQRVRDPPLAGCRVLRLVEQQVIQPAVELIQHPGGPRLAQQPLGAADQIVVFQQRAPLLPRRHAGECRFGGGQQRGREGDDAKRPALVVDLRDARLFGGKASSSSGRLRASTV